MLLFVYCTADNGVSEGVGVFGEENKIGFICSEVVGRRGIGLHDIDYAVGKASSRHIRDENVIPVCYKLHKVEHALTVTAADYEIEAVHASRKSAGV